jgi:uncharacterized RDD family membrane protein YckC
MPIYINTNQNVKINYETSSIGDRLIAYLIDMLVIAGIAIGTLFIGWATGLEFFYYVILVILFFYHLICEISMNGQSIGKRSRGIRVMKRNGNAASFSAYFLRFLLRPIDSFYALGIAVIFFTNDNQRIGDLAAGTIVVKLKTEDELKNEIKQEMTIHQHEEVKYPEVSQLSDQNIQLIRSVLSNRVRSRTHKNILQLAEKITQKLDIQLEDNNSYAFLERVVQDYYKLHS